MQSQINECYRLKNESKDAILRVRYAFQAKYLRDNKNTLIELIHEHITLIPMCWSKNKNADDLALTCCTRYACPKDHMIVYLWCNTAVNNDITIIVMDNCVFKCVKQTLKTYYTNSSDAVKKIPLVHNMLCDVISKDIQCLLVEWLVRLIIYEL